MPGTDGTGTGADDTGTGTGLTYAGTDDTGTGIDGCWQGDRTDRTVLVLVVVLSTMYCWIKAAKSVWFTI